MKTPGILNSIVFALLASLAGGVSVTLLPIIVSETISAMLIIAGLSLAYLIFLIKQAERRRGRVLVVTLWLGLAIGGWLLGVSPISHILLQLTLIWIVRSLYFHTSVLTALLDLVLIVMAASAGFWAVVQTDSFIAAVWCFFLAQSLFVLIPEFSHRGKPSSGSNPAEDHFQNAHRVAEEAVRQLSVN
ncbi:MAG: hypothetical protein OEY09_01240 [Gammaproteobacteria bacterium]|nr:hypothetical protein [Gammaproteobacteria bacterium]